MIQRKVLSVIKLHIFWGVVILCLFSASVVYAISRGYVTNDTGLKPGMMVKLDQESTAEKPRVVRGDNEEINKLIGIAVTIESSSVTIASSEQSVYIETNGDVDAYVSDLNGQVKKGDSLTISPLKGILEKSGSDSRIVVGTALEDFPADGTETHEIKTAEGTKITNIATMRINIDQKSLLGGKQPESSLEKLGRSLVGKQVSEARMIIALVIAFLVILAEGGILYGAVSSAITSLGRNPMAKEHIRKELFQIFAVSIVVLIVGFGAVYLVIWV